MERIALSTIRSAIVHDNIVISLELQTCVKFKYSRLTKMDQVQQNQFPYVRVAA